MLSPPARPFRGRVGAVRELRHRLDAVRRPTRPPLMRALKSAMARRARQPLGPWRYVFLTLAALAVALKVAIRRASWWPPRRIGRSHSCPATARPRLWRKRAMPRTCMATRGACTSQTAHASPCIFAGHGPPWARPRRRSRRPSRNLCVLSDARPRAIADAGAGPGPLRSANPTPWAAVPGRLSQASTSD